MMMILHWNHLLLDVVNHSLLKYKKRNHFRDIPVTVHVPWIKLRLKLGHLRQTDQAILSL